MKYKSSHDFYYLKFKRTLKKNRKRASQAKEVRVNALLFFIFV